MKNISLFIFFMFIFGFINCSLLWAAQVHLAWDPSTGDVLGYRIYYGIESGKHPYQIDVGNVTDYVVDNLNEGVTYYFVVRAYNNYGESGDSNEVSFLAGDITPPGDVVNVIYHRNGTSLSFSWQNPDDTDYAGVKIVYTDDDTEPLLDNNGNIQNGHLFKNVKKDYSSTQGFLPIDKSYKFSFFTYDNHGNYSHTYKLIIPKVIIEQNPLKITDLQTKVNFSANVTPECQEPVSYNWKLEENSSQKNIGKSKSINYIFQKVGSYNIVLVVTHGDCSITVSRKVEVQNYEPNKPATPQITIR